MKQMGSRKGEPVTALTPAGRTGIWQKRRTGLTSHGELFEQDTIILDEGNAFSLNELEFEDNASQQELVGLRHPPGIISL